MNIEKNKTQEEFLNHNLVHLYIDESQRQTNQKTNGHDHITSFPPLGILQTDAYLLGVMPPDQRTNRCNCNILSPLIRGKGVENDNPCPS